MASISSRCFALVFPLSMGVLGLQVQKHELDVDVLEAKNTGNALQHTALWLPPHVPVFQYSGSDADGRTDMGLSTCNEWCFTLADKWETKCAWGTKTCNTCTACEELERRKPCPQWCDRNSLSWGTKCSWTSRLCITCDECLQDSFSVALWNEFYHTNPWRSENVSSLYAVSNDSSTMFNVISPMPANASLLADGNASSTKPVNASVSTEDKFVSAMPGNATSLAELELNYTRPKNASSAASSQSSFAKPANKTSSAGVNTSSSKSYNSSSPTPWPLYHANAIASASAQVSAPKPANASSPEGRQSIPVKLVNAISQDKAKVSFGNPANGTAPPKGESNLSKPANSANATNAKVGAWEPANANSPEDRQLHHAAKPTNTTSAANRNLSVWKLANTSSSLSFNHSVAKPTNAISMPAGSVSSWTPKTVNSLPQWQLSHGTPANTTSVAEESKSYPKLASASPPGNLSNAKQANVTSVPERNWSTKPANMAALAKGNVSSWQSAIANISAATNASSVEKVEESALGPARAPSSSIANASTPQIDNVSQTGKKELVTALVAVHSKRDYLARRDVFRGIWHRVRLGRENFVLKFAVCNASKDDAPWLQEEESANHDMLVLPCEDGFTNGSMTHKQVALIRAFQKDFSDKTLLLQLEDDTFVAWNRLQARLQDQDAASLKKSYIGVPISGRQVNRDTRSVWYQPESVFASSTYPVYMQRGAFGIGSELVSLMLNTNVAAANLLANHEQAVGVWVDQLKQNGTQVEVVQLAGSDNPDHKYNLCRKTWKDFPDVFHHGVDAQDLDCLSWADSMQNPNQRVDVCLSRCRRVR